MNKCRYCNKELEKSVTGWLICKCNEAQTEWVIQMEIQGLERNLTEAKKRLSKLRDSSKLSKEKSK